MVRETSQMFITGPDVVKTVTGEDITQNGLGGADVHAETSGVAHFAYDDEETCLAEVRYLLAMLPQNNRETPRTPPPTTRPDGAARPSWTWSRRTATAPTTWRRSSRRSSTTATAWRSTSAGPQHHLRAGPSGRPGGGHRRQPAADPGRRAGHRGLREGRPVGETCDAFNIPIVTLLDGALGPARVDQEHGGIIRMRQTAVRVLQRDRAADLTILRKAYGGAYIVMDSQSIGADLTYAWPTNEIAVMGAGRRGRRHLPPADRPGRRPRGHARPHGQGVQGLSRSTPTTPPNAAWSTTSSTPPPPARSSSAPWPCCTPNTPTCPPANTATPRSNPRPSPPLPVPDFPFPLPPFPCPFPCREQTRRSALRAAGRGGRRRGPAPPRRARTGNSGTPAARCRLLLACCRSVTRRKQRERSSIDRPDVLFCNRGCGTAHRPGETAWTSTYWAHWRCGRTGCPSPRPRRNRGRSWLCWRSTPTRWCRSRPSPRSCGRGPAAQRPHHAADAAAAA